MIVTFISECEKKALNRTRRVLDSFANRIGNNAWQTVITTEGLRAVHKLLKKTATKNTAVSCHLFKSRIRTELLWIVGNRQKFNANGYVPVNLTNTKQFIGDDLGLLPIDCIEKLAVMAALFHDLGKASKIFQKKLKSNKITDDYRHEWVSVVLFASFVSNQGDASNDCDSQWLEPVKQQDIHQQLTGIAKNIQKRIQGKSELLTKPLAGLPPIAQMIAWLILSHHRLPYHKDSVFKGGMEESSFKRMIELIEAKWGYQNNADAKPDPNDCFIFPKKLPSNNSFWQAEYYKAVASLQQSISQLQQSVENGNYRLILTLARACLILGDHYYSSQEAKHTRKNDNSTLYANTLDGKLNQSLEEHLLGVAKQTRRNCKKLQALAKLPCVFNKNLQSSQDKRFKWQEGAVKKIKKWREQQDDQDDKPFGFFAINIASTGTGKTLANAKIMQALSPQGNSMRYILALGLRTLTLQTGDEYRRKIQLDNHQMAVIIGSKAIADLHHDTDTSTEGGNKQSSPSKDTTDSESTESLIDDEINFSGELEQGLDTILTDQKAKKLLYAPILVCTIDQVIGASETTRGGKHILPSFRLLSSDLVIDEVDDFEPEDLVPIGRLVHLAGMFGRKVILSSATIAPAIAEGFYKAYQAGWDIYAKTCNITNKIGCFWCDEFQAKYVDESLSSEKYAEQHQKFIQQRIKKLQQEPIKRKGYIVPCEKLAGNSNTIVYFKTISNTIVSLHNQHHFIDPRSNKKISIGIVRMANIKPCVELTKFLLGCEPDENYQIKSMAYHSQQVLLMRHQQEKYLDSIIKNRTAEIHDECIREHIDSSSIENLIFVVIATPVAEVGRDHDYDWAIIEPSSMRSIIQMAGRVLRHRVIKEIKHPNIALLQYNYRALKNNKNKSKLVFRYPGFQRNKTDLDTYNLGELCPSIPSIEQTQKGDNNCRIDATERIQQEKDCCRFAKMEHKLTKKYLQDDHKGSQTLTGWIQCPYWLTAICQKVQPFRTNNADYICYYYKKEFCLKDSKSNEPQKAVKINNLWKISIDDDSLNETQKNNLWLNRDYDKLLDKWCKKFAKNKQDIAYTYGEITIRKYDIDQERALQYSPHFGLWRK